MVLREKSMKMSMIFDGVLSEQSMFGLIINTECETEEKKIPYTMARLLCDQRLINCVIL